MSILKEYEDARWDIGIHKFDAIEVYLNHVCPKEKYEKYENELKECGRLPYEVLVNKIKELREKYNVILLDDVLNTNEWYKFEKWYFEDYKKLKVEIIDVWKSDFDDVRCTANIYKNNKHLGSIIYSDDGFVYEDNNDKGNKERLQRLIYDDFEKYEKLPKISKCSKLLQKIYDNVCESESNMCHITNEDWEEDYADYFNEKDVDVLKGEVKKHNLKDVISFNESEYKILGWGNVETSFIDDRKLNRNRDMER